MQTPSSYVRAIPGGRRGGLCPRRRALPLGVVLDSCRGSSPALPSECRPRRALRVRSGPSGQSLLLACSGTRPSQSSSLQGHVPPDRAGSGRGTKRHLQRAAPLHTATALFGGRTLHAPTQRHADLESRRSVLPHTWPTPFGVRGCDPDTEGLALGARHPALLFVSQRSSCHRFCALPPGPRNTAHPAPGLVHSLAPDPYGQAARLVGVLPQRPSTYVAKGVRVRAHMPAGAGRCPRAFVALLRSLPFAAGRAVFRSSHRAVAKDTQCVQPTLDL